MPDIESRTRDQSYCTGIRSSHVAGSTFFSKHEDTRSTSVNFPYIHRGLAATKSLSVNKNGCNRYNLFDNLHFLQHLRNAMHITFSGKDPAYSFRLYLHYPALSERFPPSTNARSASTSASTCESPGQTFFKNQPCCLPLKGNKVDRIRYEPGNERKQKETPAAEAICPEILPFSAELQAVDGTPSGYR